jgi:hypothetical protein
VRDNIHARRDLVKVEFAILRQSLLKIVASFSDIAARVRLAFATVCPEAAFYALCQRLS